MGTKGTRVRANCSERIPDQHRRHFSPMHRDFLPLMPNTTQTIEVMELISWTCLFATAAQRHPFILPAVEPRDDDDDTQINQNPTNRRAHKNSSRHNVVDVVGAAHRPHNECNILSSQDTIVSVVFFACAHTRTETPCAASLRPLCLPVCDTASKSRAVLGGTLSLQCPLEYSLARKPARTEIAGACNIVTCCEML